MKKIVLGLIFLIISLNVYCQNTIQIFDNILFYDGYAKLVEEDVPDGIIRLKNSLYSKKLSDEQLASFGNSITMKVIIKAACDNYDRLANVNLAFVPKDSEVYNPEEVERIEIARFITPFMNKNIMPDTVHYDFEVDYLKEIFKNKNILDKNDIWVELEVFGIPYAAQKQVQGCDERIDVFYGSLIFISSSPSAKIETDNILIPLIYKHQLNNYEKEATDEIGKTIKTIEFNVDHDLKDVKIIFITSNHGANEGGEEYIRREHFISFDGKNILTYIPGRKSCEPYRYRNTQPNGIYERSPRTDEEWQSFSNWCPGDVIDTRIVELNKLSSGKHNFKIEVPEAEFHEQQGYFPLSVYLIGKSDK